MVMVLVTVRCTRLSVLPSVSWYVRMLVELDGLLSILIHYICILIAIAIAIDIAFAIDIDIDILHVSRGVITAFIHRSRMLEIPTRSLPNACSVATNTVCVV